MYNTSTLGADIRRANGQAREEDAVCVDGPAARS